MLSAISNRALIILLLISLGGCVSVNYKDVPDSATDIAAHTVENPRYQKKIDTAYDLLVDLDASVDPDEARLLAKTAVIYPMQLAESYGLTWPPILHNVLVNKQKRPRGLCIHWAEDMLVHFSRLQLKTIDLHWGVANLDSKWPLEHSSVVATAIGQPFAEGVVLDGWRHSGDLYSGLVSTDKYKWQELHNEVSQLALMIAMGRTVDYPGPAVNESQKTPATH